eukprot:362607-Chlamydomonas_euryale.AAC.10
MSPGFKGGLHVNVAGLATQPVRCPGSSYLTPPADQPTAGAATTLVCRWTLSHPATVQTLSPDGVQLARRCSLLESARLCSPLGLAPSEALWGWSGCQRCCVLVQVERPAAPRECTAVGCW